VNQEEEMSVRATEIRDILRSQIQDFEASLRMTNVGNVIEVGDGIATVYGLSEVRANELVEFQTGAMGMAFNLQEDAVGVIILGGYTDIEEGHEVRTTGRIAAVPVGSALVGRVVDALGNPIDGKGPIASEKTRPIKPASSRSTR
jgi:F-type H+-transporting ATPase subunit alpha